LALGKPRTQLPQVIHRGTFRLSVVFGPFATGTPLPSIYTIVNPVKPGGM